MDITVQMIGIGGVDRLKAVACLFQEPVQGTVRVRHEAIGVNFIDIYQRTGLYALPLPATLGVEGAGIVEAVGENVTGFSVGDRVAYAGAPVGAYTATRLIPAARLVRLPNVITSEVAAASMLKGLTAHMLLTHTYHVEAGTTLLVHAAAGGLGSMLVRWAKHLGATVIGTAGSLQKEKIALAAGADHVIVGRDADIAAEVARLTNGRGVDFAIDGIGGSMLQKTLACVRRFGTVASIGQASGPIPPIAIADLGPLRSLSLACPSVMAYAADINFYSAATDALLDVMQLGVIASVGAKYRLSDVATAHTDLESGSTTGSLILIP